MTKAIAKARRPYFIATPERRWAFSEREVEFDWHQGMSLAVRQRSSAAMAEAIVRRHPEAEGKVLEVSTKSENQGLGRALSALNLQRVDEATGVTHPVENWFQASKRFTRKDGSTAGPYPELLEVDPVRARRYVSSTLTAKQVESYSKDPLFTHVHAELADARFAGFELNCVPYPTEPRSAFYDYLYVGALAQPQNADLARKIGTYRYFTDIEFNPRDAKGHTIRYNTQARSCAIFCALLHKDALVEALADIDSFISAVNYL